MEDLKDFGDRIADEIGHSHSYPISTEWQQTKSSKIQEVAKVMCHYRNGGSPFNSCCSGEPRCRVAAIAAAQIYFEGYDR